MRKAIQLVDRTRGEVGPLSIAALNDSSIGMAGVGLGIYGSAGKPDQNGFFTLDGSPLFGDSLAKRVYMVANGANVPSLSGEALLNAQNFSAKLKLNGIAEATATNGQATARATIAVKLDGPELIDHGRIYIDELIDATSLLSKDFSSDNIALITSGIEASGSLGGSVSLSVATPWNSAETTGSMGFTWTDLKVPDTLSFTTTDLDLDRLLDFSQIDSGDIVAALKAVLDHLRKTEKLSVLEKKLPIAGKELSSLIELSNQFEKLINDYESTPATTLTGLKSRLLSALGTTDQNAVVFSTDLTNPARPALKIAFNFSKVFDKEINLNLDLKSLGATQGLANLDGLVDVKGTGKVRLFADANLHVEVGIDFSNPQSTKPFLYDATNVSLGLKAWAKDIDINATVLSFGVKVNDGFIAIDSDGVAESTFNPADRVTFTLGLSDSADGDNDGRIYFDALSTSNLRESRTAAQFVAHLPMLKASDNTALDALSLSLVIPAANSIVGSFDWSTAPTVNSTPSFNSLLAGLNLSSSLDGFFRWPGRLHDGVGYGRQESSVDCQDSNRW